MSMERKMKPVVITGLCLFVGLQAITGFATGGPNMVPSVKQHINGAATALAAPAAGATSTPATASTKAAPLVAQSTGSAPIRLSGARTLDWNVVIAGSKVAVLAVKAPASCRTLARRLLDEQLGGPISLSVSGHDSFGRALGTAVRSDGADIAVVVSGALRARCA